MVRKMTGYSRRKTVKVYSGLLQIALSTVSQLKISWMSGIVQRYPGKVKA
jgi:hypothetical protein